jgi:hypothetical protein
MLVIVTCQAPVLIFNGVRLAAAMTVAVKSAITIPILWCICVPHLLIVIDRATTPPERRPVARNIDPH